MNRCTSFVSLLALCLTATRIESQVVWSDEFNSDQIDSEVWIHDVGGHGFGNGQRRSKRPRAEF